MNNNNKLLIYIHASRVRLNVLTDIQRKLNCLVNKCGTTDTQLPSPYTDNVIW